MSIKWNEDITMSDVKKFLNQEVSLKPLSDLMSTEVDFNKCAQTVAIIAVFGVIPAFTYGTVLGTLDGQRVALMGEVSGLQAQVINSLPVATSTLHSASTDKASYTLGTPTTVSFYSSVSSTTNVVNIDLYNTSGTLVQRIASMVPYAGANKYTFTVATSSIEKGNIFAVRVTAIKNGQFVNTNRFEIVRAVVAPKVSLVSSTAAVQANILDDASDDQGVYNATFDVAAQDTAVFIELGSGTRGYGEAGGVNYTISAASIGYNATTTGAAVSSLTRVSGGVVQGNFVKIDAWSKATFKLTVYFDPTATDFYRLQLYAVKYNEIANRPNRQVVLSPALSYQTSAILVKHESVAMQPLTVDVTAAPSATIIPGFVTKAGFPAGGADIGAYRFRVKVTANEADRYILTNKLSSGFSVGMLGVTTAAKTFVQVYSNPSEGDTEYGYKIAKGASRYFDVVVLNIPSVKVQRGFSIGAVNYANSAEAARNLNASHVPIKNPFSTNLIELLTSREFKG